MADKKAEKRNRLNWRRLGFVFVVILVMACFPFFKSGFFEIHDQTHFERLYELDKCLKSGQIPCRIAADFMYGYGYPIFNFYAPLAYYLGEVFYLLGLGVVVSVKMVFLLAAVISFLGMYFLVREFWGEKAGLVAAVLYIFTPYRALNFYIRGALTESLALGLVPVVVFLMVRGVKKRSFLWSLGGGLFYGFLILSHNITSLIFSSFLLITVLYFGFKKGFKRNWGKYILTSLLIGLLISCFFWLPALAEKSLVRTETMTRGILDFHLHFPRIKDIIYSKWTYGGSGANFGISAEDMSFQLGLVNWLVVFAAFLILSLSFIRKKKMSLEGGMTFVFFAVAIFLVTSKSKLIWEYLPFLSYVQFPWRFLGWGAFFSSILAGFVFKKYFAKKGFSGVLIFMILTISLSIGYFKPKKQFEVEEKDLITKEKIMMQTSGVTDEYLPKWVKVKPIEPAKSLIEAEKGKIQLKNVKTSFYETSFNYQLWEKSRVFIKYIYYPGFEAFLDGKKLAVDYSNKRGLVSFMLPEGKGRVKVVFGETFFRKITDIISGLSLMFVIFFLIRRSVFAFRK